MTDKEKLKAIRAEVYRRYVHHGTFKDVIEETREDECSSILDFIDSMQENPCDGCTNRKGCITCENGELRETMQEESIPKFKVGDTIRNIDSGELFHIEKVDSRKYWDGRDSFYIIHQDCWELVEEPVSETTTKWPFIAGNDYICIKELYHFKKGKIYHCVSNNYLIGEFGTVTPEHFNFDISDYFMKTSDSKIKFKKGDSIKDISSNKIIKITAIDCDGYFAITDNSHEVFLPIVDQNNWELVEPVSEKKCMFTKDNYTDEDRMVLCEDCKEKCEYSKAEEPVSEVLDKEVTHYLLYEHCSPLNEIMHKADLKSEMQYHKDIENAFKAGARWQKEQMMANAVDGEVGYWNQRGLSVNMDLPRTLEEDDKVKLIIIKEG